MLLRIRKVTIRCGNLCLSGGVALTKHLETQKRKKHAASGLQLIDALRSRKVTTRIEASEKRRVVGL